MNRAWIFFDAKLREAQQRDEDNRRKAKDLAKQRADFMQKQEDIMQSINRIQKLHSEVSHLVTDMVVLFVFVMCMMICCFGTEGEGAGDLGG